MPRPIGLYILDRTTLDLVYGPEEQRSISQRVEFLAPPQTRASIASDMSLLGPVEFIFSGWSPPIFDDAFFEQANLKAIFYAAGPMSLPAKAHQRGIVLTTAHVANSLPVAEYSLATILFSLKHGWRLSAQTKQQRRFVDRNDVPGCYGSTVGLISLGAIGRMLLRLLAPFDLNVLVHDPFLSVETAAELGVEKVSLEELFSRSEVVSLHAPLLPETRGMIGSAHFTAMKRGSTFINTARGGLIRHDELIEAARGRPDLQFVLDVTDPFEPPAPESALYDLPNVVLTPHMAGSAGGECRRLGRYMVDELERYLAGQPLRWAVAPEPSDAARNRPQMSSPRLSVSMHKTSPRSRADVPRSVQAS